MCCVRAAVVHNAAEENERMECDAVGLAMQILDVQGVQGICVRWWKSLWMIKDTLRRGNEEIRMLGVWYNEV